MKLDFLPSKKYFGKTHLFAFLFILIGGYSLSAENSLNIENTILSVTGTVIDATDKEPLIGVSVTIKNGTVGTTTDINGNYSLTAEPTDVLVFSYIGMATQEVSINNRSVVDVALSSDSELLDEIVVVGYGSRKKIA